MVLKLSDAEFTLVDFIFLILLHWLIRCLANFKYNKSLFSKYTTRALLATDGLYNSLLGLIEFLLEMDVRSNTE